MLCGCVFCVRCFCCLVGLLLCLGVVMRGFWCLIIGQLDCYLAAWVVEICVLFRVCVFVIFYGLLAFVDFDCIFCLGCLFGCGIVGMRVVSALGSLCFWCWILYGVFFFVGFLIFACG